MVLMREGYWDYMGRRLREDEEKLGMNDMWKKEIAEMQGSVHALQLRVKSLTERVHELTLKVTSLGGDPDQLELEFKDVTR